MQSSDPDTPQHTHPSLFVLDTRTFMTDTFFSWSICVLTSGYTICQVYMFYNRILWFFFLFFNTSFVNLFNLVRSMVSFSLMVLHNLSNNFFFYKSEACISTLGLCCVMLLTVPQLWHEPQTNFFGLWNNVMSSKWCWLFPSYTARNWFTFTLFKVFKLPT